MQQIIIYYNYQRLSKNIFTSDNLHSKHHIYNIYNFILTQGNRQNLEKTLPALRRHIPSSVTFRPVTAP